MTSDNRPPSKQQEPRLLDDHGSRKRARLLRDFHWQIMERISAMGCLNICVWNKYRQEERPDELRLCLFSGMEWWEWVRPHQNWFVIGEYQEERHTNSFSLTDAGCAALADRAPYDMEPVSGGLVEPGWQAVPLPAGSS